MGIKSAVLHSAVLGGQSVVAGAATDTWNPSDKSAGITLSNGNLTATRTSGSPNGARSTLSHSSGKYHFEITIGSFATFHCYGIAAAGYNLATDVGNNTTSAGIFQSVFYFNGQGSSGLGGFSTGDIIAYEVNLDGDTIVAQNFTQNPGVWVTVCSIAGISKPVFMMTSLYGGNVTLNCGGSAYAATPTSGYGNW